MGVATWIVTCDSWGLQTFSVNGEKVQVKVDGWKRLTFNSNYEIQTDGKFVRVYFHHASNSTVPKVYDYSLPNGYYPAYNVATISSSIDTDGVHFADFSATTDGVLRMRLRKQTYNTSTQTIYGMLVYPI